MLGDFLVILVPNLLQLFLLLTVLIYLRFEFICEPLYWGLELLNFRLLEVECLALIGLALVSTDIISIHSVNALPQIRKLWFFQGDLLTTVALLLLELNLILWCTPCHLLLMSTRGEPATYRSIL